MVDVSHRLWIDSPELLVLYRDYLPEDLEIHLKKHSIDGTITVQAAPIQDMSEASRLLDPMLLEAFQIYANQLNELNELLDTVLYCEISGMVTETDHQQLFGENAKELYEL